VLIGVVATLLVEEEDRASNEVYKWIRELGVKVEDIGVVYNKLGE
jgi:hypothetical protein